MKITLKLLLVVFLFTLSCKKKQETTVNTTTSIVSKPYKNYDFNTNTLLQHVKTLSSDAYEGRRTGTKGAEKSRAYIINQFNQLNVKPLNGSFEQSFSFKAWGKAYEGVNVLGFIKGTDSLKKHIVISAHYDHEGIKKDKIYNGADDNASGVGALIALAEYFKQNPPKHNVVLAAFDAEEIGLKGAYHFVDSKILPINQIGLNINFDMIGRNKNNELYVVGANLYEQLKPAINNISLPQDFSLLSGHDGLDNKESWVTSSDHTPFHKKGIPFLYFGVEDHEDYHKPTDDFEKIKPVFYQNSVQTIIKVIKNLDEMSF